MEGEAGEDEERNGDEVGGNVGYHPRGPEDPIGQTHYAHGLTQLRVLLSHELTNL